LYENCKHKNLAPTLRPIRPHEIELIAHLLAIKGLAIENYTLPKLVDPYENDKMGSISLGTANATFKNDIVQVKYVDADGVDAVISLTQDTNGHLLDLDFWKVDFSKLLQYPKPDQVIEDPFIIG
jgi:hypothetical protein